LAKGKSETGVYAATINVTKGGPQEQVSGTVSFPVPLCKKGITMIWLTEAQSESAGSVPQCLGSTDEPEAEEGYLCVFMGSSAGNEENKTQKWQNASFHSFAEPNGTTVFNGGALSESNIGALVVFRTNTFAEGPPLTVAANASATAGGGWGVTEN
jgi:hypothetical protein